MDDLTGKDTYTAEQPETLESGLRILARMVVCAHLHREGAVGAAPKRKKALMKRASKGRWT